ncbi:MAG: PAS domain S-box protein [Gemmatimonadaceae bacterium]
MTIFSSGARNRPWPPYLLAAALSVTTLVLRIAMGALGVDGESTQAIYLFPILVSAHLGGLGPGLLATVLCAVGADYFTLPPLQSLAIHSGMQLAEWLIMLVLGSMVSLLSEASLRARHRAEVASRLQAVTLASIGDAVLTTDVGGHVTFLNSVAEVLTGWRNNEAMGQPLASVFRIVNEETRSTVVDPVHEVVQTGKAVGLANHTVLIARDGRETPIADSAAPIHFDGRLSGVVLVFRDVSEEKRAEGVLREQLQLREDLARIAQTAPGVIYSFRLRPDGSMCVPYASPSMVELFQLDQEALARDASGLFEIMLPEDRARVSRSIQDSAKRLVPWQDEFRIRRANGSERWLDGHSVPVADPDGGVTWHGFVNDVTERKKVAQALRATRETLQLLIEQAPVSIAMLDRQMTYLAASGRWQQEFGRGYTDLVGRRHYDIHPDLPDAWKVVHRECLAGAVRSSDGDLWEKEDGTPSWVRWAIHPWRAGNGDIGGIIIFAEDITKERLAHEVLAASEQRYRDLVRMSPDAILLMRNDRIVYANEAAIDLMGAPTATALEGLNVLNLVHPADRAEVEADIRAIEQGEEPKYPPHRILRFDGAAREVEVRVAAYAGGEGKTWQVVLRDITERKRHELQIEEREARLSGIINAAMDGIITIDADQRIVLVNAAAERVFMRSASELIGQTLDVLIPKRLSAAHSQQVIDFARTGGTSRRMDALRPVVGVRANGEEFPIEASISQVEVGGRRLLTVILRDITDRQRSEAALRESNERFQQLAANIHEVFWLTDPAKSRIEYVSPAYERIWGRPCSAVYGSADDWITAIHAFDRDRVVEAAMTKQALGTYDEEYRIVRPDGSVRWIRDRAAPVRDASGAVIRVAGVAEDITERRELQSQLQQAQKLESIGRLAGGIAHDFNNWLTVIGGNSELLLHTVAQVPDAVSLIAEIRHAGDRAASLTRQLLAFSRQQVLEPRVSDLNVIVTDTEKMLQRLIGEDVELRTTLGQACMVEVDPGHMVQVLMNLAVNARDAMPTGGRLTIETSTVELDAEGVARFAEAKPGTYVRLSVTDTGVGMSPDVCARVFEPFFTTKAQGHGTGLGLSVVHGIVEQSGGHIDVVSEVGVGTTFAIYLTAVTHQSSNANEASTAQRQNGHEAILLVEDEDSVRRVTSRSLRAAGYVVHEAANGEEALALLAREDLAFDLLMTDVVMPGVGGRAVADAARKQSPNTHVLFMSGYTDDAVVRHGVSHSEVAFLQKPYTVHSLLAKVRETIDRAPGAPPTKRDRSPH